MSQDDRLSRIDTLWSVVRRAHAGADGESRDAQEDLLRRYGGAVRRYLLGALRNEPAADELYQEFALRFVQGDYSSADPQRGRFRAFLKVVLSRLVTEYYRKHKRRKSIPAGDAIAAIQQADQNDEAGEPSDEFANVWRDELLSKAWGRLREQESSTSRPLFTVMDAFVSQPELNSTQQAEQLSCKLAREITPQNARVILHRARAEFANFLVAEVRETLQHPTREALEEELIELRLHKYCRGALSRA